MREHKETVIELTLGEATATIRRGNSSRVVVAGILGQETDASTGRRIVWLDRLVHRHWEQRMQMGAREWSVSGAVSSVLTEEA